MTVTTALYRRYRPDSFADVIGQEHVTEPLMTALRKNRVNHAYLFSGPRGCGKTTSARILARCLNCAQGPTDTPCGTCPSCIELARGGSGSLDVIEIDAASHGGVDDARDLRERATYAPVRDRYKIFIIDEAHMVTSAGFNALLKIVEEPPEHIKFIFATTEPDKVIGTIRSRTHHYPFRLVPPEPLMAYLELLCNQENVPVAPGVLSLVVRAGGGSVRDSLSVLDQLMAGAGPNGLDYELAVALLGYTHASLLDDVVEAVAASDAATVFRAVDRVIQTGHDPRRFVEDLLERFRDLIVVQAMPESAQTILRGMPADQIARLQNQAHNLGAAELSRAADVTNTALTEMTGATSPRLHLELLCARILLPSSEQTERGIAARIDRVERRLNYAGNDAGAAAPSSAGLPTAPVNAASPAPAPVAAPAPDAARGAAGPPVPSLQDVQSPQPAPSSQVAASLESVQPKASPVPPGAPLAEAQEPRSPLTAPRVSTNDWPVEETKAARPPVPEERPATAARPVPAESPKTPPPTVRQATPAPATTPPAVAAPTFGAPAPAAPVTSGPAATGDVEVLRRAWPEILQTLSKIKRSTWALVEPNAQVGAFDGQVLTLSFTTTGLAGAFGRADHSENLRQAIHKTVGIDCQITAVAGTAGNAASSEPNPKAPVSQEAPPSSADVAWGLAPAGAVPPSKTGASGHPAPPAGDTRPASAAATASPVNSASGASADAVSASAVPSAGASPSPHAAPSANASPAPDAASSPGSNSRPAPEPLSAAPIRPSPATDGSFAYSDDDWGPPRDEDAPPLDEEPPMDWAPSSPAASPRASSRPGHPRPEAAPAAMGDTKPTPSSRVDGASAADPAAVRAPAAAGAAASPRIDTAQDPWAKAVEQAPGVWVIGSETNVGKTVEPSVPAHSGTASQVPDYEPATAQIPQATPSGMSEADASWGLSPGTGGAPDNAPFRGPSTAAAPESPAPDGPSQGEGMRTNGSTAHAAEQPPAASEPAESREYAMAAAGPAAAALQPAPATSQSAATARQSLYQRLSNSPEAEAGRAKAPARAAATTYVQDIPSADDETIEESGVFGRAAVERILGGKLIEERAPDGSPIDSRF